MGKGLKPLSPTATFQSHIRASQAAINLCYVFHSERLSEVTGYECFAYEPAGSGFMPICWPSPPRRNVNMAYSVFFFTSCREGIQPDMR